MPKQSNKPPTRYTVTTINSQTGKMGILKERYRREDAKSLVVLWNSMPDTIAYMGQVPVAVLERLALERKKRAEAKTLRGAEE